MKKFDYYFNAMMVMALGCASVGSFIDHLNGAIIGAVIGGIFGFLIVFFRKF